MKNSSEWENEQTLTRAAAVLLRDTRLVLGLKQEEVAGRSHGIISTSWLSTFERGGIGGASFLRVLVLAEIYGIALQDMAHIFLGTAHEPCH